MRVRISWRVEATLGQHPGVTRTISWSFARSRGRNRPVALRSGPSRVSGIETALIVPVPEAEPVVGSWRRKYASDAANGMWAHVTLIYPFRESSLLNNEAVRGVADVLSGFASFPYRLTTAKYFHSPQVVLYLGPEPATPFENLIRALSAAFPDTPPYGGAFENIVPHLSIADEQDAGVLTTVEADVRPRLPIEAIAREVELVEHTAEGWRLRQTFMLAPISKSKRSQ